MAKRKKQNMMVCTFRGDTSVSVAAWEFRKAEIVTEAVRIARECLDGDPMRAVPELERQASVLFEEFDGGDRDLAERTAIVRGLPAYAVAASALGTAKMAGNAYFATDAETL